MRFSIICFFVLVTNVLFGQLKGAVKQNEVPPKANEKREVKVEGPQELAKNNADKLRKSLVLTDAQYNSLLKVFVEYETGVDKTEKSTLSKQAKYEKINALSFTRRKKMKSILTPEQYNAYLMSFP